MQLPKSLAKANYSEVPFEAWRSMWLGYIQSSQSEVAPEVHQYTYDRIRKSNTSLQGFVAMADRPVGFVHYFFHPSSYSLADACTIEDLYVAPEFRGMGVGRWLIEGVAQIATASGAPALHWKARPSNAPAIALYRQLAVQVDLLSFRKELQQ